MRARSGRKALAGKAASFASLGYAVPGSVVAVGVLTPFAAFDNTLSALSERLFGVPTGLVLTGGMAALIFAYLVLYLAVALQSVGAGLERVTPSISAAARLLARGPFDALKRVHLPLITPSVLTAALLVFVDVMKELPATLDAASVQFRHARHRGEQLRVRRAAVVGGGAIARHRRRRHHPLHPSDPRDRRPPPTVRTLPRRRAWNPRRSSN